LTEGGGGGGGRRRGGGDGEGSPPAAPAVPAGHAAPPATWAKSKRFQCARLDWKIFASKYDLVDGGSKLSNGKLYLSVGL